jgi:hydroxymethylglutaryl-CoA lyase
MLHELGVETGIDLERLIRLARSLEQDFRRPLPGQLMRSGPRLPPSSDASEHH